VGAVDEGFGQVDLAVLLKVSGESGQDGVQNAAALPLLEAVVARLIRRVAAREIRPRRSRAKDPQDPVEHVPGIPPRSSATGRRALPLWLGDAASNRLPLLVGEIHRRRYKHLLRAMEIASSNMEQSRSLTPSKGCRMRSSVVRSRVRPRASATRSRSSSLVSRLPRRRRRIRDLRDHGPRLVYISSIRLAEKAALPRGTPTALRFAAARVVVRTAGLLLGAEMRRSAARVVGRRNDGNGRICGARHENREEQQPEPPILQQFLSQARPPPSSGLRHPPHRGRRGSQVVGCTPGRDIPAATLSPGADADAAPAAVTSNRLLTVGEGSRDAPTSGRSPRCALRVSRVSSHPAPDRESRTDCGCRGCRRRRARRARR
jgi:hypothetical protein